MSDMKKCPHCGENLSENARFCHYCMNSLEEKTVIENRIKKPNRFLYIGICASVVVAIVIVLLICLLPKSKHISGGEIYSGYVSEMSSNTPESSELDISQETDEEYQGDDTGEYQGEFVGENSGEGVVVTKENGVPYIISSPEKIDNTQKKTDSAQQQNQQTSPPKSGNNQSGNNITEQYSGTEPSYEPKSSPETTPPPQTTERKETETTKQTVSGTTWYFRASTQTEYSTRYFDTKNGRVTIVGLDKIPDNGIVVVPAEINGYVVVSVNFDTTKYNSFKTPGIAEKIKKVYFPPNCESLKNKPFEYCVNLSDVYFAYTGTVDVFASAFAPVESRNCGLTIHCSSSTRNSQNYYPFSYLSSQTSFNATYEEWDGTEVYK